MALTAKPISTISYNTVPFLQRKLDGLYKANIIEDWMYIWHEGEDGDKDHIHLWIQPNRRLDTAKLREEFNEVPSDNQEKPLGCMPFRSSKVDHWMMYVLHDPDYLVAHHSQTDGDGKIEYKLENIICQYPEQRDRTYRVAVNLKETDNQKILNAIKSGIPLSEIAFTENINPSKILAMNNIYKADKEVAEYLSLAVQKLMMNVRMNNEQWEREQERTNEQIMTRDLINKGIVEPEKKEDVFDEQEDKQ